MNNDQLTEEQRAVLLEKATEAPFSGKFLHNKADGTYVCANCKAPLFLSSTKFDSGSGWPSFDDAIAGSITEIEDTSHGMIRVEAACSQCGGHLGHVFPDGPKQTTGMRFCINSLALDFKQESDKDKNDD